MNNTRLILLLASVGVPFQVIPWCVAQCRLETGNFTNHTAKDLNNYSCIKYTASGNQKNSKPDPLGTGFALFTGMLPARSWARDYVRVLSMGKNPPIEAVNPTDFGKRLIANGYTKTDLTTYTANIVKLVENIKTSSVYLAVGSAAASLLAAGSFGIYKLVKK